MKTLRPTTLCIVIFGLTGAAFAQNDLNLPDVSQAAEVKEALEFEFEELKPESTAVTLKWEKLGVPFTVSIKDSDQTLQNIRSQLKGRGQFTWQALDEGAQFCLTRKINLDEALRWADASVQNEERFDNLSTKADILKAL